MSAFVPRTASEMSALRGIVEDQMIARSIVPTPSFQQMKFRKGAGDFLKHLISVPEIHQRASYTVCQRLGTQGQEYDWDDLNQYSRLQFPITECERCRRDGYHTSNGSVLFTVIGCKECVQQNNWTWGSFLPPEQPGLPPVDRSNPSHWIPIPCNGIVEGDVNEMTNLELILDTLHDIWDSHPDYDPPKWRDFFDRTPRHLHMIVCTALKFWTSPDVVKDWCMEPGQPMVLQNLYQEWKESQVYATEYILEDDVSDEAITEVGSDEGATGGDDEDIAIDRIGNLEPRELFQEDDERERRRTICREGQALLDSDGEFNEEKYRQLCNVFMRLHQSV
jgi:hypothetical protein